VLLLVPQDVPLVRRVAVQVLEVLLVVGVEAVGALLGLEEEGSGAVRARAVVLCAARAPEAAAAAGWGTHDVDAGVERRVLLPFVGLPQGLVGALAGVAVLVVRGRNIIVLVVALQQREVPVVVDERIGQEGAGVVVVGVHFWRADPKRFADTLAAGQGL
jgi:hypothetical protein